MSEIIKCQNITTLPEVHKCEHEGYEFYKQPFLAGSEARDFKAAIYTIPPQKSGYPYHFHTNCEEVFYIIKGKGLLRTPEGEKEVCTGDMMYFPANEDGAHKLSNISETEDLVYLDFDSTHDIDVSFYPDSKKFGIWGKDINKVYESETNVEYYKGE